MGSFPSDSSALLQALPLDCADSMGSDELERRLSAILSADAVGYSRLMAQDESGTIRTVTRPLRTAYLPKWR